MIIQGHVVGEFEALEQHRLGIWRVKVVVLTEQDRRCIRKVRGKANRTQKSLGPIAVIGSNDAIVRQQRAQPVMSGITHTIRYKSDSSTPEAGEEVQEACAVVDVRWLGLARRATVDRGLCSITETVEDV